MIYGSVCSGIEAASVAWHPMGWNPAWFCEFEKFPSAVLTHHYPDVPNLGDMTTIEKRDEFNERTIDLLVGGTPCQSFSIAGLRKGLDDDRGNLALKFCEILKRKQPRWFVWENVPGVLSSDNGRDFAAILSGFSECGYGFAYRILDAQYFGVAQRRRRVFVVGYLGDWRRAAAVLFERDSLRGYPAPRRKTGQGIAHDAAPCLTASGRGVERCGESRGQDPVIAVAQAQMVGCRMTAIGEYECDDTASKIKARDYKDATDLVACVHGTQDPDVLQDCAHTLGRNSGQENALCYPFHDKATRHQGGGTGRKDDGGGNGFGVGGENDPCPALTAGDRHSVAFGFKSGQGAKAGGIGFEREISPTLIASESGTQGSPAVCFGGEITRSLTARYDSLPCVDRGQDVVFQGMAVRRLTPRECERLQGFPDDYTLIPYRGGVSPDGQRYKALGNSMAVPVMRWIGERIQMVEALPC